MECKLLRVVDGDTIECNIPNTPAFAGDHIKIRFRGADAPELRTKDLKEKAQGKIAKRNLEKILWARVKSGDKVMLRNVGRGKFFRVVADVYAVREDGKERYIYVYPKK